MRNHIYYLSEENEIGYNAGSKARIDVSMILDTLYKKTGRLPHINAGLIGKIKSNYQFIMGLSQDGLNPKDILILQFPLPVGYNRVLPVLNNKYKCVYVIHDLEGLRHMDSKREREDIYRLRKAFKIISHNRFMTDYLVEKGVERGKIINLELFDYLVQGNDYLYNHYCDNEVLCFAGNLEKSEFLKKINSIDKEVSINLYGRTCNVALAPNVKYCGGYDADEIPKKLRGKFGLVWDGTSCDTCDCTLGNYMMYNNPHKLSMYISAGIPVVTWEKAAVTEYIEKKNIGLAVGSLREALERIQKIDKEQYGVMYNNVLQCREEIINGKMLLNALRQVEELHV